MFYQIIILLIFYKNITYSNFRVYKYVRCMNINVYRLLKKVYCHKIKYFFNLFSLLNNFDYITLWNDVNFTSIEFSLQGLKQWYPLVFALLKKPTWDPHGMHVGTMWVPCGTFVGPCGNHVGTMWDPCENLLRDLIGNHVGPHVENRWSHMTNLKKSSKK